MIFLACDGGSTKTEWVLTNENGDLLSHLITKGCNYTFLGEENFKLLFKDSIDYLIQNAKIKYNDITSCMFSITMYGELKETVTNIPKILKSILPDCKNIYTSNDSLSAWAGSLACKPGINIISGTGSIAYGKNNLGKECRAGGWSLFFADEGSCSWIGRKLIEEFVKQADNRKEKTKLYKEFKKFINIDNDNYIAGYIQDDLIKDSSSLANLQKIMYQLALDKDEFALKTYNNAVDELVELAIAIKNTIFNNQDTVIVSYSGGLFNIGDLVLKPFNKKMKKQGFILQKPIYSPIIGAIGLCAQNFISKKELDELMFNLSNNIK